MKIREWKLGKLWMEYRVHLAVTVCLLLVAASIPFETYYHRQFQAEELYILEGLESFAALVEEGDVSALVIGAPEEEWESQEGYSGFVAESARVTLQDGDYLLQVVSLAKGEHYFEVYSAGKLNEDNTQGEILARELLQNDRDVTEIPFTVTESMEDICFRVFYGGEGSLNISGFYLASVQPMYTDILCLMGAVLLFSAVLLVWKLRGGKLDHQGRTAVIILSAAAGLVSLPLSYDFVLDGNDLYYQFNRILGIQEGLKSGQFPVKIHSTLLHGYGYGSSVFYPELFLYIPAFLGCLGVSLVNCYKVLLILINAATALIAYKSFSEVLQCKKRGLTAALLYTLSIYRLIDLYTRAAVGEALAMTFLPLVLWGMYELFLGKKQRWYVAALGFTGVMQSHVLTTELVTFFGCLFGICFIGRLKEKGRIRKLILAAGFTVLLNLGIILPLLHHAGYPFRVFSVESVLSWWTATLPKIFDFILANPSERTYAGIQSGGEMPCSLGFLTLMGMLAFLYSYYREEKREPILRHGMFAFVLGVLGIYLSTNLFPWDKVQKISVLYRLVTSIQIPWRFLALSSVLLCVVCAIGFHEISREKEARKILIAGVWTLAFLCAGVYVNRYCEEGIVRYTQENQYQREQGQVDALYFMNVDHANSYRIWNRENIFVPAQGVRVQDTNRSEDLKAAFTYTRDGAGEEYGWVDVPFTYYPNYKAQMKDGTSLETGVGEQGVVRVYLPEADSGEVLISYREPWVYHAGRLLSLCAGIALICVIWKKQKEK